MKIIYDCIFLEGLMTKSSLRFILNYFKQFAQFHYDHFKNVIQYNVLHTG